MTSVLYGTASAVRGNPLRNELTQLRLTIDTLTKELKDTRNTVQFLLERERSRNGSDGALLVPSQVGGETSGGINTSLGSSGSSAPVSTSHPSSENVVVRNGGNNSGGRRM